MNISAKFLIGFPWINFKALRFPDFFKITYLLLLLSDDALLVTGTLPMIAAMEKSVPLLPRCELVIFAGGFFPTIIIQQEQLFDLKS